MGLADLTREAVLTAIAEFDELGRTAFLENYGFGPAREYFVELNGRHYDSKAIAGAAHRYANAAAGPLAASEFSGGELTVKRRLEALGFRVSRITDGSALADSTPPGSSPPALPLTLHARYGRHAAFAAVAVAYTPQNQHQNTGLSPRCPDGGHLVFITLDKSDLNAAYDYDDELFGDRLRWVTRRDRGENHSDYIVLRDARTRLSVFVRHNANEDFVYLGEVRYRTHREFRSEPEGRVQQEYVFDLLHRVPEHVLTQLTAGLRPLRRPLPRTGGARNSERTRRPASLDGYKKAFSYALGRLDRTVEPAHHNYQVRLRQCFVSQGVDAEWERDYVDVQFRVADRLFIGEIKVTGWLRLEEAFRVALGQLLEYGHLRFEHRPGLVMFLDQTLDVRRVRLASDLGVAVVSEVNGAYLLVNPATAPELQTLFGANG